MNVTTVLNAWKTLSCLPRWQGPSSTTRSLDSDDVLFIEENPYADFSPTAWGGSNISNALQDALSWLDTSFLSSSEQCYVLEGFYERCLDLVSLVALVTAGGQNVVPYSVRRL